MTSKDKIKQLRDIIDTKLRSLITSDYIYIDLPYHGNIGDTLIWQGTTNYLKRLPYKCLYTASCLTYFPHELSKNTIILLHGGGNFGDLYRLHSDFRRKIISSFPNNKIIILPQTVYYEDKALLSQDARFYSQHKNVTICAREQYSYDLLKAHFSNDILLVPDMAFFVEIPQKELGKQTNRILYLKRTDKELVNETMPAFIPKEAETHDWPTYEQTFLINKFYGFMQSVLRIFCPNKLHLRINDYYYKHFYKPFYVNTGIKFLSSYSIIYTTRLHVMILGILMHKKLYLINNSSGKVMNYYNTWLRDLENINTMK